jgi:hypothetical protein
MDATIVQDAADKAICCTHLFLSFLGMLQNLTAQNSSKQLYVKTFVLRFKWH